MTQQMKNILVPTDFSACAEVALAQGLVLARLFDAELHVLHVMLDYTDDPYGLVYGLTASDDLEREQQKRVEEKINETLEAFDTSGLTVHQHVLRAPLVAPRIVDAIEEQAIDLIVMGGHGRRGVRRFLLGSIAEEVVRVASCPVLTVREQSTPIRQRWPGRMVVPMDFSEHSRLALEAAWRLAGDDSHLDLVHVIEEIIYPQSLDVLRSELKLPQLRNDLERSLGQIADQVGIPSSQRTIKVTEGRPAARIVEAANDPDVDLVVIATHGLTGLEHLLLGSVTEKVVRSASCPVLTLKSRFASKLETFVAAS